MYNSWNKGVRAIYTTWEMFEKVGSIDFNTLKVSVVDKINHVYLKHTLRKEIEILITDLQAKEQTDEVRRLTKRLDTFGNLLLQYHLIKKYRRLEGYTITLLNHNIFLKKDDFLALRTLNEERKAVRELLKNGEFDISESRRKNDIDILNKHFK